MTVKIGSLARRTGESTEPSRAGSHKTGRRRGACRAGKGRLAGVDFSSQPTGACLQPTQREKIEKRQSACPLPGKSDERRGTSDFELIHAWLGLRAEPPDRLARVAFRQCWAGLPARRDAEPHPIRFHRAFSPCCFPSQSSPSRPLGPTAPANGRISTIAPSPFLHFRSLPSFHQTSIPKNYSSLHHRCESE